MSEKERSSATWIVIGCCLALAAVGLLLVLLLQWCRPWTVPATDTPTFTSPPPSIIVSVTHTPWRPTPEQTLPPTATRTSAPPTPTSTPTPTRVGPVGTPTRVGPTATATGAPETIPETGGALADDE